MSLYGGVVPEVGTLTMGQHEKIAKAQNDGSAGLG